MIISTECATINWENMKVKPDKCSKWLHMGQSKAEVTRQKDRLSTYTYTARSKRNAATHTIG